MLSIGEERSEEMTITPDLIIEVGAVVGALGVAYGKFTSIINKLKKPINDINEKIDEMKKTDEIGMARIDEHEARLNTHKEMLDKTMSDSKAIMSALLLLLSHAETGNNTGEIAKGRKELEEYLNNSRY